METKGPNDAEWPMSTFIHQKSDSDLHNTSGLFYQSTMNLKEEAEDSSTV